MNNTELRLLDDEGAPSISNLETADLCMHNELAHFRQLLESHCISSSLTFAAFWADGCRCRPYSCSAVRH